MKVTFCGHGKIIYSDDVKRKLYQVLEKMIQQGAKDFMLGGYGNFDIMSAYVVHELKNKYPDLNSYIVIPYKNQKYDEKLYDCCLYPNLSNVSDYMAIPQRNKYMINKADIVVAYVENEYGGAAKTLKYAIEKNKKIINLANIIK